MGSCCSYYEPEDAQDRGYLPRQPAASRSYEPYFKPKPNALFGEYKCGRCGHFWTSRLSWRDRYQECKLCRAQVSPKNQRELRPTDFKRGEDIEGSEHPQHLCEMCQRVGGYCGNNKF